MGMAPSIGKLRFAEGRFPAIFSFANWVTNHVLPEGERGRVEERKQNQ